MALIHQSWANWTIYRIRSFQYCSSLSSHQSFRAQANSACYQHQHERRLILSVFGIRPTIFTFWVFLQNRKTFVYQILFILDKKVIPTLAPKPELSTDRMDPRVGSGHDFAGFWRVGSGRVSTLDLLVFTDYFLVPESIWVFEYYIRIDWFSSIFNI